MGISIFPVTPDFVAEIGEVELSRPLSPEDLAAIKEAFWKYAVLIFPDQRLSAEQHMDVARHFGPLEEPSNVGKSGKTLRLRPELADVSNLDHTGSILTSESFLTAFQRGNRLWHTDASFRRTPSLCSLLYANVVPPIGGHTEFADQRAAYDALPEELRRQVAGRVAEHSIFNSRRRLGLTEFDPEDLRRLPPVPQALVRTMPQTGRKSLYVAAHAGRIFGMPDAEGRALIDRLIAHVIRREFVYTHRWRERDLVMWDNRCTLHRGTAFDEARFKRDLQRATVSDVANSCEQEGLALPDARQAG